MANFPFRVYLRETLIGKVVIGRLQAPGADKQAESRRWIELGFAAEQAGFRLDGTTLKHAERVVASIAVGNTDPLVQAVVLPPPAPPRASVTGEIPPQVPAPSPSVVEPASASVQSGAEPGAGSEMPVRASAGRTVDKSPLAGNLRSLSHTAM